ncbi:MAG: glucose-6-phosphate isomerase [Haloquadratum sp.]|jgi:Glucose-6-phosphate isomerase|nr:glucose-6-phosphate isomerase [Haloferacaceae archaeon]MDR9445384.1 glucose-6-phosphate isomerase [Haloquadratum sp.]
MRTDVGGVIGTAPGVSEAELSAIDGAVTPAVQRVLAGAEAATPGYHALNLPEETDLAAIDAAAAAVGEARHIVTVGIGGSALGAQLLTETLCPARDHRVLDSVDPLRIVPMLESLTLEETVFHVVSQSGETPETLANLAVVREVCAAAGVAWQERTVITTGATGRLAAIAAEHAVHQLPPVEGVPGRFSVLSPTCLFAPAVWGVDLQGLCAGAGTAVPTGATDVTAGVMLGAVSHRLAARGASVIVMMPYADQLGRIAEWFAQLWAESLGKDGSGQTPVKARGVTDQHSQLQLYRDGPADKLICQVRVEALERSTAGMVTDSGHAALDGHHLGAIAAAERLATRAALARSGVPVIEFSLEALSAEELGALIMHLQVGCMIHGELAGVTTFDQPAVEWGKTATIELLETATGQPTAPSSHPPRRWVDE